MYRKAKHQKEGNAHLYGSSKTTPQQPACSQIHLVEAKRILKQCWWEKALQTLLSLERTRGEKRKK